VFRHAGCACASQDSIRRPALPARNESPAT
jgi:hypothetical protein